MENKRNSTVNSRDGGLNPVTGMDFLSPSRNSSLYDPYASGSSGSMTSASPLRSYAGVLTGTSAISPVLFTTPVKLEEEDVLVMDGFPLLPPNLDRTTPKYSFSGGSSNLPGSGISGGGTDNSKKKLQKKMCRYWEKDRYCRFGSNCRFAHITDDQRSVPDSANNKLEIGKLYLSSGGSTSSPNGTNLAPSSSITSIPMPALPTPLQAKLAPESSTSPAAVTLNPAAVMMPDWSPEDDGIEVTLPFDPPAGQNKHPRGVVDAYIRQLLYGRGKPRLPVFKKICPD